MDQTGDIVVSDACQRIREEIQKLQMVLASLTSERDDLRYHICPELNARYMREVGDFVNRLNYQSIMIREMKRRIEIAQAALNYEKTISAEEIDEQVETEYRDYHKKVYEAFQRAEQAKKRQREQEEKRRAYEQRWQEQYGGGYTEDAEGNHTADEGEDQTSESGNPDEQAGSAGDKTAEKKVPDAKELYRQIVKKLHPDVNPNVTEHEKELFYAAVKAYREGDLVTLQKIYDEVFSNGNVNLDKKELSYDELVAFCDKIKSRIATLKKEIDEIRGDFPYNMKDFLDDADDMAKKRKELERQIRKNEETQKRLTAIYERICDDLEKLQNSRR